MGTRRVAKRKSQKVVFDLSDVIYLDSSGVGILMMCHAKLKKAGGSLHIAGAQGMVEETLEITSVNKIVKLYPTAVEAAQAFQ